MIKLLSTSGEVSVEDENASYSATTLKSSIVQGLVSSTILMTSTMGHGSLTLVTEWPLKTTTMNFHM
jgi:hypothetical protein